MTAVGLAGIILSLLAWPIASVRSSANHTLLFLALLAIHVAACVAYFLYVQTTSADSAIYYFDGWGLRRWDFRFGTVFTVQLVQFLKDAIGGTYLDYFLLFQSVGFWGIALLMRTFEEIHLKLNIEPTRLSYFLLFLPGIHFWTSAIGKDAPMFFAVSLAVWASLRLPQRAIPLAAALGVMVLFRPHLALICAAAIAAAEFFSRRSSTAVKWALLLAAGGAMVVLAGTVQTTLKVDVTSAESLASFVEGQHNVSREVAGTTAVLDAPFIVRFLSLLFRPLFFDASGIFALVASFENLLFLFIAGAILANLRLASGLVRRNFFLRFVVIFATVTAILLSVVYYNVGLGARQKVMMVPPLFAFFVALWAVRSAGRTMAVQEPATTLPMASSPMGEGKHV